jgi:hypothetical protein
MKYLFTLLTLALASIVMAQPIKSLFTVNLLTRVTDMSTTSPGTQIPIHWANATIKHVYDNEPYSVIGSATFEDLGFVQVYHINTEQWSSDVSSPPAYVRCG